jgi:hypothetical protein
METTISNFFFKERKALMTDRFMMIVVKSRTRIQFTPKSKFDSQIQSNGLCQYRKIRSKKHLISCYPYWASLMIKCHNNGERIIVQAIEANNRRNLIKSKTGQYIHWT